MTFSTVTIDNDKTGETEVVSADVELVSDVVLDAVALADVHGWDEVIKAHVVAVARLQDIAAAKDGRSVN